MLFHMVYDIKNIFLVIELLKIPKPYLQTQERGYLSRYRISHGDIVLNTSFCSNCYNVCVLLFPVYFELLLQNIKDHHNLYNLVVNFSIRYTLESFRSLWLYLLHLAKQNIKFHTCLGNK